MKEDLFEKYFLGTLTTEDEALLRDLVRSDQSAGKELVEFIKETSMMISCAEQLEMKAGPHRARSQQRFVGGTRRPRARVNWGVWLSVAACLAIIVGAHLVNLRQAERMPDVMMAKLATMSDAVRVERNGNSITVYVGMDLFLNDAVRTGKSARARVEYGGEATSVEIMSDTEVEFGDEDGAKRIDILEGAVEYDVAPQPEGKEMAVRTPHAIVLIKGTRFQIAVGESSTQLEVYEGLVAFSDILTGQSVEVVAGHMASVGVGISLAVKAVGQTVAKKPAEGAGAESGSSDVVPRQPPNDYVVGSVIFQDDFDKNLDNWDTLVGKDVGSLARAPDDGRPAFLLVMRDPASGDGESPSKDDREDWSIKDWKKRWREGLGDWPYSRVRVGLDGRYAAGRIFCLRAKAPVTEDAFEVRIFPSGAGEFPLFDLFPSATVLKKEYHTRKQKMWWPYFFPRWECVPAGTGEDGNPIMEIRFFIGGPPGASVTELFWYTTYISCTDKRIAFLTRDGYPCGLSRVVVRKMIKK